MIISIIINTCIYLFNNMNFISSFFPGKCYAWCVSELVIGNYRSAARPYMRMSHVYFIVRLIKRIGTNLIVCVSPWAKSHILSSNILFSDIIDELRDIFNRTQSQTFYASYRENIGEAQSSGNHYFSGVCIHTNSSTIAWTNRARYYSGKIKASPGNYGRRS